MTTDDSIDFEDPFRELIGAEWKAKFTIAGSIAKERGESAVPEFIKLLSHEDAGVRSASALALRDIGDDRAVEPLFRAVFDKGNRYDRGAFIFALEKLDCGEHFRHIFKLIFADRPLVQDSAMTIFMNQSFFMDDDDLNSAHQFFEKHKNKLSKSEWEDEIVERLEELKCC